MEDVEVFPNQISEADSSLDWQYADGRFHAKGWFLLTVFQGVLILWRVTAPSATKKRSHLSALLCLPPFPMPDEYTLHYAHLQSNKETTVWTCPFSLCISPTLQMTVSICNNSVASFCEEYVLWGMFGFHLTAPDITLTHIISPR